MHVGRIILIASLIQWRLVNLHSTSEVLPFAAVTNVVSVVVANTTKPTVLTLGIPTTT